MTRGILPYAAPNEVRANKNRCRVFKDCLDIELNVGDTIVFSDGWGCLHKGEVEGFTRLRFVKIKYSSAYKGDYWHLYKEPSKVCKIN